MFPQRAGVLFIYWRIDLFIDEMTYRSYFRLNTSYNWCANLSCLIESLYVTNLRVIRSRYVMNLLERMSQKCEASTNMPKVIAVCGFCLEDRTSTDTWQDHLTLILITHNHLNRKEQSALQLREHTVEWIFSPLACVFLAPSCRNVFW